MCPANHYTPPMHCHVRPFPDLVICTAERLTRLRALWTTSFPPCQQTQTVYSNIVMPNRRITFVHGSIAFCKKGWPKKERIPRDMFPYWSARGELTLCRDLLLRGKRIVVPASLRTETLEKIHSGHQGLQRCLLQITSAVWWPQVKDEIEQLVQNCPTCTKASVPQR